MSCFRILLWATFLNATASVGHVFAEGQFHVLLVGASKYYHLDETDQLEGPATDVQAMGRLMRRFVDNEAAITILAEDRDREFKPTRENIIREYQRLIEVCVSGDQIIILHAGHGSQDIDDDPNNPDDREPDGLDEIFLPADVRGWEQTQGCVIGAIRDDEIRQWLTAMRQKGAFVFFVSDSCHSESQTRGRSGTKTRGLDLIPETVRRAIPSGTDVHVSVEREMASSPTRSTKLPGDIVALYAARANQETPDWFKDPDTREGRSAGLLVYTLCRILRCNQTPLTYRELGQQIRREYAFYRRVTIGADVPDIVIEGTGLDREVFGDKWRLGRSTIRYRVDGDRVRLTCSRLEGVLPGSTLDLYPPAGSVEPDRRVGSVVVTEAEEDHCWAALIDGHGNEASLIAGKRSVEAEGVQYSEFPSLGRAEVRFQRFGERRLKISVDSSAASARLRNLLSDWKRGEELIQLVSQTESTLHLEVMSSDTEDAKPSAPTIVATRSSTEADGATLTTRFDLGPIGHGSVERIESAVQQALRHQTLLEAAETMSRSGLLHDRGSLQVSMRVKRDGKWGETESVHGYLRHGDQVEFAFRNNGVTPLDFAAFYLDDQYAIQRFAPIKTAANSTIRLAAHGDKFGNDVYSSHPVPVTAMPRSMEAMLVYASPAGADANWDRMWQTGLPIWTSRKTRGGLRLQQGLDPMRELLSDDRLFRRRTRQYGPPIVPKFQLRLLTWSSAGSGGDGK